ncbi:MAG: hypothetical protein JF599_05270 [Verrucomicrobia bacterium]|nr:hypothetical protein [Verrucomicrobiota bacterium]
MKLVLQRWQAAVCALLFSTAIVCAETPDTPGPTTLSFVRGQVLLRAPQGKIEFAKAGRVVAEGATVVTGENAHAEVKPPAGLWRLGRRAVFTPRADGARLLAGTVLAVIPAGRTWSVESARGLVALGEGTWILQAVDNEGLKLICLDGPAEAVALGEVTAPAPEPTRHVRLRPGELAFLLPGGRAFGPVVTIFLQELLATSRLVQDFPDDLPDARRLKNLATAQGEQLKAVSNALVAGAQDEKGFQLVVPKPAAKK